MISICIPIFNSDINLLVLELEKQISKIDTPIEILLIDDASDHKFMAINGHFKSKHQFIFLEKNIGRSRIRNLFLKYARHRYLCFLDSDTRITQSNFLLKYINYCELSHPNVLIGGVIYEDNIPPNNYKLRWKYGKKVESLDAASRLKKKQFISKNFLIKKEVFQKHQFDESIKEYGHEDTLLGLVLDNNEVLIDQIDNPVMNVELESNKIFLNNTANSVKNLWNIYTIFKNTYNFDGVKLIRLYQKLSKIKLLKATHFFLSLASIPVYKWCLKGKSPILLFNMYKLKLFLDESKNNQIPKLY